MLRVEMMMSRRGTLATVLDWYVHCDEKGAWYLTVSDVGDRIFSVRIDSPANIATEPATAVARLWPIVRAEEARFEFGDMVPTHLQAEVRVQCDEHRFWLQASTWIWQDGRVVAYRSHPTVVRKAMPLSDGPPTEIAQSCFEFAATLEDRHM
jgi:hypothetical protein